MRNCMPSLFRPMAAPWCVLALGLEMESSDFYPASTCPPCDRGQARMFEDGDSVSVQINYFPDLPPSGTLCVRT